MFAYPDFITDGTVAMSCSLSLFIIPVTVPAGLTECRQYIDLLLNRMRRNQTSIRRLFPTSSSSSSSTSFSASTSTCYSPLTFSPVPISIEEDESTDNVTPIKSDALEKRLKSEVEKAVKEEKEEKREIEMIRCSKGNDAEITSKNYSNDENNYTLNDNQEEGRCHNRRYYSVHKQDRHNVNRNGNRHWNKIGDEGENKDEDEDEDGVVNSGNRKCRSKNKTDSACENENIDEYRHKRKDKGSDKKKKEKREGTIMEWSAIGSLNWDILFLLGGGFALSEGFQVR